MTINGANYEGRDDRTVPASEYFCCKTSVRDTRGWGMLAGVRTDLGFIYVPAGELTMPQGKLERRSPQKSDVCF